MTGLARCYATEPRQRQRRRRVAHLHEQNRRTRRVERVPLAAEETVVQHRRHVQVHPHRTHGTVRQTCQTVHLRVIDPLERHVLDADGVDLVVDVETLHVLAVAFHHVDEIVHAVVVAENDLRVVDSVLRVS